MCTAQSPKPGRSVNRQEAPDDQAIAVFRPLAEKGFQQKRPSPQRKRSSETEPSDIRNRSDRGSLRRSGGRLQEADRRYRRRRRRGRLPLPRGRQGLPQGRHNQKARNMAEGIVKWFNSERALALSRPTAAEPMCSSTTPRFRGADFVRWRKISESDSRSNRDPKVLRRSE